MNWLDIVIVLALVFFALTGLAHGLIVELFQIGGIILGVILAGRYYSQLEPWLSFLGNANGVRIFSFIIIFVVVLMIAYAIGSLLKEAFSLLLLGPLDHLLGLIFGFIKGALVIQLVLIAFAKFPLFDMGLTLADSRLAPYFLNNFPVLLNILPADFEAVKRFFK